MASNSSAFLRYIELETLAGEASEQKLAILILNRPAQANSFSARLLSEITELLDEVANNPEVRVLLLQGEGKHFSAGADLNWMKEASLLDYEGNLREAEKLTRMFEALANLKMPSLALVKGAVFGGAVGLVAACDYALAWEGARFCLSEAKIGLIPAVILPYLARKLPASHLHRQVLSARVFTANEAIEMGLVQAVYPADLMEEHLHEEVNSLLSASPEAQSTYKSLFSELSRLQWQQGALTAAAIAEIRASSMGQAGLGAYFQKAPPPWILRVPKSACLGLA